ncbi:MAG: carbonic anhydrase [Deltaproteobacteria bacterium]|nr:carbonic anhydrase [Deltaproteobacteria bacterium]
MRQKLVHGIHHFETHAFAERRELFERLASKGQNPETLFLTCSDSRVVPNLITSTEPGDLFIVRNVGNCVGPPDLPGATSAALEYALKVLDVDDIIVCGHTDCGAIQAILDPARLESLPYVQRWLASTERVRDILATKYQGLDEASRLTAAVLENVLVQLENLRAFDFVAERLARGTLRLSGLVFDIHSGKTHYYDPAEDEFLPLVDDGAEPLPRRNTEPPPG